MDPKVTAFNFFVTRGWSPEQAAGIVGNLAVESFNPKTGQSLDPMIVGDNGRAFGIAQWHPDRQAGLAKFAQANGLDYRSLEGQLAYVDYELRNSEKGAGDRLRAARTPEEATDAFMRHYERPNLALAHFDRRLANAMDIGGSGAEATGTPVIPGGPMIAGTMPMQMPEQNPLAQAVAQAAPAIKSFGQAVSAQGGADQLKGGDTFGGETEMADTPGLQPNGEAVRLQVSEPTTVGPFKAASFGQMKPPKLPEQKQGPFSSGMKTGRLAGLPSGGFKVRKS